MAIATSPAQLRELYLGLMGTGCVRGAAGLAMDVLLEEASNATAACLDDPDGRPDRRHGPNVQRRALLVLMLPERILDDVLGQLANGAPPFNPQVLIPLLRLPSEDRVHQGSRRPIPGRPADEDADAA